MAQDIWSIQHTPIRLQKILFATDFSHTSEAAFPYGAAIARRFRSEIYVAHVIPPDSYAHIPPERLDQTLRQMKEAAMQRIEELLAGSRYNEVPFQVVLDHGDILTVISSLVQNRDIDLIVAGSHGRHGIQKLLSPSVDEAIVQAAACAVLLVGPEVSIEPAAEVRLDRILYPTDYSPQSRRAMDYAYAFAHAYGADLYALHVVEDVWKEPLSTRMPPEAFCRIRLLENGLPQSEEGIEPQFLVEFGPPETLILEVARKRDVQLIVLAVPGSTHPHLSSHLPGPLAYNIASHSSCPVLAVRNAA